MREVYYVTIGNSDDKLSQREWCSFQKDTDALIRKYASEIHGVWYSSPESRYQNMNIGFEFHDALAADDFLANLKFLCSKYRQDSILLAKCDPSFVVPDEA